MVIRELRLRTFRNYTRLDWCIGPGVHVLTGGNGQGKTNLLEAIYLLSTMKSFRGARHQEMIQEGHDGYFVGAAVQGEYEARVRLYRRRQDRKLTLNEEPVASLHEFLGVVKTVVFSSEDIQLVKGSAAVRRRFLDLVCAQTQPGYLKTLQNYNKAVKSRNILLKRRDCDRKVLAGFTHQVVTLGNAILDTRRRVIPKISPMARLAFRSIAEGRDEELIIEYRSSVKNDFQQDLDRLLDREFQLGSTTIGPHRDDIHLKIHHREASKFASEGQQRTLVLALKLAQIQFLHDLSGASPILLIDDVMGELDHSRRKAFIPLLEKARHGRAQVIMTCTEPDWPANLTENWQFWTVSSGKLSRK